MRPKVNRIQQQLFILAAVAFMMIGAQLVNAMTGGQIARDWGLWPRHISGLPGIALAPWLHGSWRHLWSNLPVLLIFSGFAMWGSPSRYIKTSAFIILGSGLLVWLFGRNSIHVGASGWLFGLWAWLIARAIFQRNMTNIIIAVVMLILYGGLWWGLLPTSQAISVESHLAGALCGVAAAWLYRRQK